MTDKKQEAKPAFTADWLMRGALLRIGDKVDQLTGRRWTPSSSLATSQLIARLKTLLDAEAKIIPGKGRVVPHNIKLKMQWDKFSAGSEESLGKLETELLAAAADHINDTLSYTFAPLTLEVKQDYFTEGVKLYASFESYSPEETEAELNVTLPAIAIRNANLDQSPRSVSSPRYEARYSIKDVEHKQTLKFSAAGRLSIGRTGGNDLILDDASVSKMHASLAVIDGSLTVADTGSTNGTFIKGERISYGKAVRLADNDVVKFGVIKVSFERAATNTDLDHKGVSSIGGIESRDQRSKTGDVVPADDTVRFDPEAGK